ncbi:MAG: hypothetical protein EBR01_08290 [Proteobacteria bacterium]|nr:hypothetical protein [Pseudomonadota bacterium]NBY19922.1 hypothetical protein [bacterium]
MISRIVLSTFLLSFILCTKLSFSATLHEEVERDYHPSYVQRAHGQLFDLQRDDQRIRYPWPVKLLSIGHTMASYQRYGGLGGAYFHHGLDIRADAGSDVLASVGGTIINIENYMPGDPAYWEVAILDRAGFIWQYHHIDRESIPQAIFDAYKNKTPIESGTKLGKVYYWSVTTFGERFHHIHLNILGKDKAYLNPFEFLELLPDSTKPEIKDFYLLKNSNPLPGNSVTGPNYTIAVEVRDLILSAVFVVPTHEITISIDGAPPKQVWKFDSLPGGADNEAFVNQFYAPRLACGDYKCRKPVIDLGFSKTLSQTFPSSPGKHTLELWVSDYNGNSATRSFDWIVTEE